MSLFADPCVPIKGADSLTCQLTVGGFAMRLKQFVSQFHREESGQDMLEYALVLAAVLAAVVTGSGTLSSTIGNALTIINTRIATAAMG